MTTTTAASAFLHVARQVLTIGNRHFRIEVDAGQRLNPRRLAARGGRTYADGDYQYRLVLDGTEARSGVSISDFSSRTLPDGALEVTLQGRFVFPDNAVPDDIIVLHRFVVPADESYFEETISLKNHGNTPHTVDDIAFGFQKTFGRRVDPAWSRVRLHGVPFQRFWGLELKRGADSYAVSDLVRRGEGPGFASEGWILADGKRGLLVGKHNVNAIEFSMLAVEAAGSRRVLRFGGVGLYRGDPESARLLGPMSTLTFGRTRYALFDGDWQEGCYRFRDWMDGEGHVAPRNYRPKVFWNVLYNLGWDMRKGLGRYTPAQLDNEARLAKELGAETIYLDPQWDVTCGSTRWDTERLGPLSDFVSRMKAHYGLGVALHTMTNAADEAEYPDCFRRNERGTVPRWDDLLSMACTPTPAWREEKARRLNALVVAGVPWLMIDFVDFPPETVCHDRSHAHSIPSRRDEHAAGILDVIQRIKAENPDVTVEAHDRIRSGLGDYHPMHFQHGLPNSFDEVWGFELMWDLLGPIRDGRAVTLWSYRLCYSIPVYLHINVGQDTPNLLGFWWYASTVNHLGIGGISDDTTPLASAVRAATRVYKRLRPFFRDGLFYGPDPYCHVHVLPERNQAVLVAFNLGGKAKRLRTTLDAVGLGLRRGKKPVASGGTARWLGRTRLAVEADVPPDGARVIHLRL